MRTYKTGDEKFDRTFINALNGIDPETLTEEEISIHEKWVNDNWNDLTSGGDE